MNHSETTLKRVLFPALVILDRDGVINEDSKHYIKSADEWIPIPGSLEAIAKMSNAGIKVGIATNQRGISLGLYGHNELTEMHEKMKALLNDLGAEIHAIEFCTADDAAHPDRKPNPGMLLKIMQQLEMPKEAVIYFIGDKISDIEAAHNAGVIPVLVRTGNGIKSEEKLQRQDHTTTTNKHDKLIIVDDLAAFADAIVQSGI